LLLSILFIKILLSDSNCMIFSSISSGCTCADEVDVDAAGVRTDDAEGVRTDDAEGVRTDDAAGVRTDDAAGVRTDDAAGVRTDDAAGVRTDDAAGVRSCGIYVCAGSGVHSFSSHKEANFS
jgi:hypothetical protein